MPTDSIIHMNMLKNRASLFFCSLWCHVVGGEGGQGMAGGQYTWPGTVDGGCTAPRSAWRVHALHEDDAWAAEHEEEDRVPEPHGAHDDPLVEQRGDDEHDAGGATLADATCTSHPRGERGNG